MLTLLEPMGPPLACSLGGRGCGGPTTLLASGLGFTCAGLGCSHPPRTLCWGAHCLLDSPATGALTAPWPKYTRSHPRLLPTHPSSCSPGTLGRAGGRRQELTGGRSPVLPLDSDRFSWRQPPAPCSIRGNPPLRNSRGCQPGHPPLPLPPTACSPRFGPRTPPLLPGSPEDTPSGPQCPLPAP